MNHFVRNAAHLMSLDLGELEDRRGHHRMWATKGLELGTS